MGNWASEDKCKLNCGGDKIRFCGGSDSISIYNTPKDDGGLCIYDSPDDRVFPIAYYFEKMTANFCNYLCQDYKYLGVQNGNECWCGNSDINFLPANDYECRSPCGGDQNEICGGSWRMTIY